MKIKMGKGQSVAKVLNWQIALPMQRKLHGCSHAATVCRLCIQARLQFQEELPMQWVITSCSYAKSEYTWQNSYAGDLKNLELSNYNIGMIWLRVPVADVFSAGGN